MLLGIPLSYPTIRKSDFHLVSTNNSRESCKGMFFLHHEGQWQVHEDLNLAVPLQPVSSVLKLNGYSSNWSWGFHSRCIQQETGPWLVKYNRAMYTQRLFDLRMCRRHPRLVPYQRFLQCPWGVLCWLLCWIQLRNGTHDRLLIRFRVLVLNRPK